MGKITETEQRTRRAPIVGVGASAGGVEALSDLLRHLPDDSGLSFVIIQHLAPRRPSLLCPALARSTTMPVVEAESGLRPEANHVYVMPPGVELAMGNGRLVVEASPELPRTHRSIDLFLRSLAEEEQSRAIGVILSGSGSDGTEGLRAIRAAGGIALVEDPASAKFPAMPESAIAAGAADRVLSIEKLAEELVALGRSPYFLSHEPPAASADEPLHQVFDCLRAVSGVDFAEYKSTTFRRRLARRMLLRRSGTLSEYLALCAAEPAEVEALARDILIHVTEFFRDPAAFAALQSSVIPAILEEHRDGAPIRVWVPGCSTGEEPYSIAMSLLEALGDDAARIPVQIFGTDLSAEMIDRARAAIYPESALQGLPPNHLERYFTRSGAGYRIGKRVRGLCTFATHDLTRDPPFARLDLISCRNVLIYFSPSLQKRVVPMFHHCLLPGGFLILGKAEAIVGFSELFSSVDKANRIFARVGGSRAPWVSAARGRPAEAQAADLDAAPAIAGSVDVRRQADNLVLGRYAPPGALVDEQMDVIHFRGRTSPFLELGPGQPDLNLKMLAHASLRPALEAAFQEAVRERVSVRREGVSLGGLDGLARVDIEVIPVAGVPTRERYFLVLFANATAADRPPESKRKPAPALEVERENHRLREEQAASRDFLQSLLDERQRMTSEFTAADEELVASNEELQSTNEELEAAKEELQSSNDELTNVNDELNLRNQELNEVNSDLVNVIASVDIPIVIVSGDRRIRRFTPGARALMNLIPSDVGRPVDDIKLNLEVDNLNQLISEVLDTLRIKELEVQDRAGHWLRLHIRPYCTVDGRLDGVVLTLTDIDVLKHAVGDATAAFDQVNAILETIRVPLLVLDERLCVRSANLAYYETYSSDPASTVGLDWLEACGQRWNRPELRNALERLLARGGDIAEKVEIECPAGIARTVVVAGSVLRWAHDAPLLLVTPVDVTEHTRLLQASEDARAEAERANRAKDIFLAMLSHELRAPLHTITLHAELLLSRAAGHEAATRAAEAINRAALAQDVIIRDLLDVSAIMAGKISIASEPVDLHAVVTAALDSVIERAATKNIDLRVHEIGRVGTVLGDQTRLQQIAVNLLSNAVKFTPSGGEVRVELEQRDGRALLRVRDTGQGISPEFLPHVFDRFAQGDTSNTRLHGGLGLGLAIVQDLVRLHGGTVHVTSDGPGRGTLFTVDLPLVD